MEKESITAGAKRLMNDVRFREGKRSNDTLRLWENYRDQAQLWRALALIQIPAFLLLLIFSYTVYLKRSISFSVPAKPLPGMYELNEVPDAEFISVAEEFVNLIATYQPQVAKRQFIKASEMLIEPFLSTYESRILEKDLKVIKETKRSQILYIDSNQTTINRYDDLVYVSIIGDRENIINGSEPEIVKYEYRVSMKTIPRTRLNPYGIVVIDLNISNKNK